MIRDIARDLGSVAAEDVNDVRSGKFEPMNLLRLHPARGRSVYETETSSVMDYSSGKIVFRKKTLTEKDYGDDPAPFMVALLNYCQIYCRIFGPQYSDVVAAQFSFISYIQEQTETFAWESCLNYAMSRLVAINAGSIHSAAAWRDHPISLTSRFFNAGTIAGAPNTPHRSSPSKKRQRTNTTGASPAPAANNDSVVCLRYNSSAGCTSGHCRRRHECSKCGGKGHGNHTCRSK
ncbi:hypothetical protein E4U37_007504 [Claviceps purpurea]|nr:hypothetical protein E4U37_007504 [Claviceps purpurea]